MVGAVAVLVDTEGSRIFASGELEPVVENTSGVVDGCRLAESVVAVAFNNLTGKSGKVCYAAEPVLLVEKALTLPIGVGDILGSKQNLVDSLTIQIPASDCPIRFPFVDGMRPVIGVIDRRSIQGAFHTTAQSIVSQIVSTAVPA